ncbi:MAG: hypothetical protein ACXADY_09320 [Candidatus Hodarchaeales archaeon]
MVNFCEKCGSFLIPNLKRRIRKKGDIALYCNGCRTLTQMNTKEISYQISSKIPHSEKDLSIMIESGFDKYPRIRNTCPGCGHHEAHYWEGGDGRKQEWESKIYYRCLKCRRIWCE